MASLKRKLDNEYESENLPFKSSRVDQITLPPLSSIQFHNGGSNKESPIHSPLQTPTQPKVIQLSPTFQSKMNSLERFSNLNQLSQPLFSMNNTPRYTGVGINGNSGNSSSSSSSPSSTTTSPSMSGGYNSFISSPFYSNVNSMQQHQQQQPQQSTSQPQIVHFHQHQTPDHSPNLSPSPSSSNSSNNLKGIKSLIEQSQIELISVDEPRLSNYQLKQQQQQQQHFDSRYSQQQQQQQPQQQLHIQNSPYQLQQPQVKLYNNSNSIITLAANSKPTGNSHNLYQESNSSSSSSSNSPNESPRVSYSMEPPQQHSPIINSNNSQLLSIINDFIHPFPEQIIALKETTFFLRINSPPPMQPNQHPTQQQQANYDFWKRLSGKVVVKGTHEDITAVNPNDSFKIHQDTKIDHNIIQFDVKIRNQGINTPSNLVLIFHLIDHGNVIYSLESNKIQFYTRSKYAPYLPILYMMKSKVSPRVLSLNRLPLAMQEEQSRANREELLRLNLKTIQKLVRVYKGDYSVGIEIPSSKKGGFCESIFQDHSEQLLKYHNYHITEELNLQGDIDINQTVNIEQNPTDDAEGTELLIFSKDFNLELKNLHIYIINQMNNRIMFCFKHGVENNPKERNVIRVLDDKGNISSCVVKVLIPLVNSQYLKNVLNLPPNANNNGEDSLQYLKLIAFTSHHEIGSGEGDYWQKPEEYSLDQGRARKVVKFLQDGYRFNLIYNPHGKPEKQSPPLPISQSAQAHQLAQQQAAQAQQIQISPIDFNLKQAQLKSSRTFNNSDDEDQGDQDEDDAQIDEIKIFPTTSLKSQNSLSSHSTNNFLPSISNIRLLNNNHTNNNNNIQNNNNDNSDNDNEDD